MEVIELAVLGFRKGKNFPENENLRPLPHAVEVRMCTSVMVWELSRLEIYIQISPGTVISMEYLGEVNQESLWSDISII